jgi:capsular exopolysaccharide synthesis family protein
MIRQTVQSAVPSGKRTLRNGHDHCGHIREYCQSLLQQLSWPGDGADSTLRTLGITSCRKGEGVSTICAQLASAAASWSDCRILLVDANVTDPSVHASFGVSLHPGWANMRQDGNDLEKLIKSTSVPNLSVLCAGSCDNRTMPADISLGLSGMVKELASDYDLTVFDLPPVGQDGDAARLAAMLDGVVLVVEAELIHSNEVRTASELLARYGARPLGVVLNKFQQPLPQWLERAF